MSFSALVVGKITILTGKNVIHAFATGKITVSGSKNSDLPITKFTGSGDLGALSGNEFLYFSESGLADFYRL